MKSKLLLFMLDFMAHLKKISKIKNIFFIPDYCVFGYFASFITTCVKVLFEVVFLNRNRRIGQFSTSQYFFSYRSIKTEFNIITINENLT